MTVARIALTLAACVSIAACSRAANAPDTGASEDVFDGINAGKWDVRSRLSSMDASQAEDIGEERAQEMMEEERSAQMCLEFSERSSPPVSMFFREQKSVPTPISPWRMGAFPRF